MMAGFNILAPGRILVGRGRAAEVAALARSFGPRGILVHGASRARAAWLIDALGEGVTPLPCPGEPTLEMLEQSLSQARAARPDWVLGLGGGAALDLAKALAALIPAPGAPMDHLEVVGRGLPLVAPPLPFLAVPTTFGTGSEVTRNAVIGVPEHARKVSLRDERMLARVAVIDPALSDGTPRAVTLASGLDAITQVIEPYLSIKANPYTDALCEVAIPRGLHALRRLMEAEDPAARDDMALVSLSGGLALGNAGLGAVHGLAGVIGGLCPAPHGAICGALLAPILSINARRAPGPRATRVLAMLSEAFAVLHTEACEALAAWARAAGLPGLRAQGVPPDRLTEIAEAAQASSSMKGNPVPLSTEDLLEALHAAL